MENETTAPEQSLVPVYKGRLLIFIVAYNAESTIESVLQRIPSTLSETYEIEVLIIDDSSLDATFLKSELARRSGLIPFKLTVLYNPVNQGYGGNQKIGFHYAIENGFDWVALVHGDGQYAPECLPELVGELADGKADAVFGSRMMRKMGALKGGMPLYKFVGNRILTIYQNLLLGSKLTEFHSGYRLYSIKALKSIPFALNSNDFHFDTEIIIQLIFAGQRINELAIPTFYGDEICHVNGMKYAWDVFKATMLAKVQRLHIFYDPKYDCRPEPDSSQSTLAAEPFVKAILAQVKKPGSNILLVGQIPDKLKETLRENGHFVSVKSAEFFLKYVDETNRFDQIFLLDDSGMSRRPEEMVAKLLQISSLNPGLKICVTVANIGFVLTRLQLLFGRFAYSRRGIINLSTFHFFTMRSAKKMFAQNGFKVVDVAGLPVPFYSVFSYRWLAASFTWLHRLLIAVRKSLFSFQFLFTVAPPFSLPFLLTSATKVSGEKVRELNLPESVSAETVAEVAPKN